MKNLSVISLKPIKLFCCYFWLCSFAFAADIENVNSVVAKVGDQVITTADIEQLVGPEINNIKKSYSEEEAKKQINFAKSAALQRLISDKLLEAEANKLELVIPPSEIKKRITTLKSQYTTEEDFLDSLKKKNLSMEKLQKMVENEFKSRVLLQEKVAKKIRVFPTEIHDFYQLNISDFLMPASVHMYQIMIKKKPDPKKALAIAKEVYAELEKGADFQQMARLKSQGPKKNIGGDWGVIKQDFFGDDMEAVEKSAFSLQPGKYGEIVETKFGYHIVFIDSKRISRILTEREAYDKIRQQIFERKFAKAYEIYMTYLRNKTYIEIYESATPENFTIKSND